MSTYDRERIYQTALQHLREDVTTYLERKWAANPMAVAISDETHDGIRTIRTVDPLTQVPMVCSMRADMPVRVSAE
jgi:hypothetical protein